MKTNAPKRKVFQDAVDLLGMPEEMAVPESNGQTMIPVEKIVPFHNHPFRLYEGERLDDMVESIKEHGVLNPVIVHKVVDGYEMLAGHNRWNAAKIAGIREIPAIVKEDLSKEEAYVYVIETNLMQRSFTDLLPSEKAAVLAERYEKVMCQGKRNDILEEIARLNGVDTSDSCGHDVHRSKSRDFIGEDYGMTGRNIARYMRLNQTIQPIKNMVDTGAMPMVVALELSYLTTEEQGILWKLASGNEWKIKSKHAAALRKQTGSLNRETIEKIFLDNKVSNPQLSEKQMLTQIKRKYFKDENTEQMMEVIEQALSAWFSRGG